MTFCSVECYIVLLGLIKHLSFQVNKAQLDTVEQNVINKDLSQVTWRPSSGNIAGNQ